MRKLAGVLCVAFAVVHAYWAFGGRLGVPAGTAQIATRPAFLTYDIAAALALLGLAVVTNVELRGGTRIVRVAAFALLARGVLGLVQDVAGALGGHGPGAGVTYDAWFALTGAVLLAISRTTHRSPAPATMVHDERFATHSAVRTG